MDKVDKNKVVQKHRVNVSKGVIPLLKGKIAEDFLANPNKPRLNKVKIRESENTFNELMKK